MTAKYEIKFKSHMVQIQPRTFQVVYAVDGSFKSHMVQIQQQLAKLERMTENSLNPTWFRYN